MYRLKRWINEDNLDWVRLSANPMAIRLLEANPEKIDWYELSCNPEGFRIIDC